jgi:hypothetical protein
VPEILTDEEALGNGKRWQNARDATIAVFERVAQQD